MPEQLLWSVMVRAIGGPQVAASNSLEVDAYDKLAVSIADGATTAVELSPGAAGDVRLLVINPAVPSDDLTYDVGGNAVPLDGPHVLLGAGAVGLVGTAASLSFTNATGADAAIEILVGRSAT